jgi:hypothetical protein
MLGRMRTWNGGTILRDSLGAFAVAAARRGATRPGHAELDSWLSPSEVAEYVYCPEAHRLRAPPAVETQRQAEGRAGHAAVLGRYRRSRALAPVRAALWSLAIAGACALAWTATGRF